ncbi:LhaA protein [Luminiphilus syltensis NOR5-1B]|uniref:LhaA protein n=2 Tax=Luminiphilus TaxID=1341118 RepID=B8KT35_9GAMM|nr:LhaA protein [Luminiphilus syltensis NOR5-1B]
MVNVIQGLSTRWLPFADTATADLPLSRLLRLSLFQISVGMSVVLLTGTLNRIMVIELGQAVWLVSLMISLPLLAAPARALIGFRSDYHKSLLGWRRVPYLWVGTLMQFGGLAIMPFALIVMTEVQAGPAWVGPAASMLAFLLVGAGMHTTQTAGLALATDLANEDNRSRVVALLYVMLLVGMIASSAVFAAVLEDFNYVRLIKVIQGAAVLTVVFNFVALWKQEARQPHLTRPDRKRPQFMAIWREFSRANRATRLLVAVALGTMGFSMQDILLEPYGAEILAMSVSQTTALTGIFGAGMLVAFAFASKTLRGHVDPVRFAAYGAVIGIFAFAAVVFAAPLESTFLFRAGTALIGLGGGLFAVGTLTAAMLQGNEENNGLALGAWGAVQATAAGIGVFVGGALRDLISGFASSGQLGEVMNSPITGYSVVYHVEIFILFAALVAIGPLVKQPSIRSSSSSNFQLADFPG